MYQVKLSSESLDIIYRAVEQASSRILAIESGKLLLPMQYAARLAWEVLYEAREILRIAQRPRAEQPRQNWSRSAVTLSGEDLLDLAQSIEQVMGKLHKIEVERDIDVIKVFGRQCQQELEGCLFGALSRRPISLMGDL